MTDISRNGITATDTNTDLSLSGNGTGAVNLATGAKLNGTALTSTFIASGGSGSGAGLTDLNASNLGSGTVPDARFPATLPAASGVNLTALNAGNLASGTVADARFPATLPAVSGVNLTAFPTNVPNVAPGTSGNLLTSTGSAWASTAAAGGGGLTLIGTQDADNSATTMTQTGLTGSDIYMVVLSQITGNTGTNFGVRVGDSSSIRSGASDYSAVATRFQDNAIGPYATGPSTGTDKILFASSGTGASGTGWVQAVFYITNPVSGTARAGIYGQNQTINNGGNMSTGPFSGSTTAAIAVDRVQILPLAGNLITGSMTVYSFNQS